MQPPHKPSDLELQILSVLWSNGPSTARQVLQLLPDRKKRAYTTVLSVMQVMEKKKFLTRTREGLTDRWRPAVQRDAVVGPVIQRMVAHLFGGRPSAVMQQLLQQPEIHEDELRSIKKLIRDYEKQQSDKNNR